jgi:4-hydroxy-3-polyprenylbenzoate decarboxylase
VVLKANKTALPTPSAEPFILGRFYIRLLPMEAMIPIPIARRRHKNLKEILTIQGIISVLFPLSIRDNPLRRRYNHPMTIRIVVAVTGASGAVYGIRTLEILRSLSVETHLVISAAACRILERETGRSTDDVKGLASHAYRPEEIHAPIASGSFPVDGMIFAPCSIKSLSAVANSYTPDLISRAADVCLKEGRPLVLLVRESPLHAGHLRLMQEAAAAGAVIFPPIPVFYGNPHSVMDIVDASVGRALARMGIENDHYPRWTGLNSSGAGTSPQD